MSYQRIIAHDGDEQNHDNLHLPLTPNSPPPSFRSRTSSIAPYESQRLMPDETDRTLADTFDSPSDDEDEDESHSLPLDERQRALSGRPVEATRVTPEPTQPGSRPRQVERRVTQLPIFAPATSTRVYGGGNSVHDGVFANLSAKPAPGEDAEEKPPSYEQAAADATPPYWETSVLTPGGASSDEVFIDGLPVGSLFSFIWNGLISTSFQLVGFLLTYLLHTTHAAKNGSKAGLGVTLIQYGFGMRTALSSPDAGSPSAPDGTDPGVVPPPFDPNSHDFDPNAPTDGSQFLNGSPGAMVRSMNASDWLSYILMIVGWFILIRSLSEYLRARRHEQLVLQSPSRGLPTPVVAESERPETTV